MSQALIRNQLRKERDQLEEQVVYAGGLSFAQTLSQHPVYQKSQHIAFYWPCQNEVDMHAAIDNCLHEGKTCYLPIIMAEQFLTFTPYTRDMKMHTNRFKVMEPIDINPIPTNQLDLVIMPAVAIDYNGNRIGMGAGFYDKTFQALQHDEKPYRIGAVYPFQIIDSIERQLHDIPCHEVIIVSTTI